MVSPTLTRMTGPGTVPSNVQTFWTKPLATVISCSVMTRSMSWTSPSRRAGAFASYVTGAGAFGSAATSVVGAGPPWSPPAVAPPLTLTVPSMPAWAWPGMEQRKVSPSAGTSISRVADWPPSTMPVVVPSGRDRSCGMVPVLLSLRA